MATVKRWPFFYFYRGFKMDEPKIQATTVSIDDIEIANDHVSNVRIKNIWENEISFESGIIAPGETGLITAAEAEALHMYVERV